MKYCINGKYIDFTTEELEAQKQEQAKAEAEYWANIDYDTAVSFEFRKRYSQDKTEATINNYLLDPTNEKYAKEMQEMQEYRAWCKAYVKEKKGV